MSDEIQNDEQQSDEATAAAAKALSDAGDEVGAIRLKLEASERALARERGARKTQELTTYRTELAGEFEYADPELITGTTKQQMRASAERLHNAVTKAIEKKGLRPAETTVTETDEQKKQRLKGEWGSPPAVANETVSGEAPMPWEDLTRAGLTGKGPEGQPMSRAEILRELANNGTRVINRPTIASAVRGRQEAAKT